MYLANLATFIATESDVKIAEADASQNLKYPRKSNRNRTIHILRKAFIRLILEPDTAIRDAMLQRIVDTIAQKPVPIVPTVHRYAVFHEKNVFPSQRNLLFSLS